jgi:putative lipoprotein
MMGPIATRGVGLAMLAASASLVCGCATDLTRDELLSGVAAPSTTIDVPPSATLEIDLLATPSPSLKPRVIARKRRTPAGNPPYIFELRYRRSAHEDEALLLRARVWLHGELLLRTDDYLLPPHVAADDAIRLALVEAKPGVRTSEILDRDWALTRLGDRNLTDQQPARALGFRLDASTRRYRVFGGCNTYENVYVLEGSTITFTKAKPGDKRCKTGMNLERAYARALFKTVRWELKDGVLKLTGPTGEEYASFVEQHRAG